MSSRITSRSTAAAALAAAASIVWALVAGQTVLAQERPEVHADFRFGSFPYSKEAAETFASENARLLVVGFHRGWSVDKFVKETEKPRIEILTLADELEETNLVRGRSDYNMRPGFPILRIEDLPIVEPVLDRSAAEVARIIEGRWPELEEFTASLEAGADEPRARTAYRVLVGGVLLGSMIDAFFDDKTLMPGPPRRGRRGGYYAWMVEGDGGPEHLIRQSARVGQYQVYSVGTDAGEEPRIQIDEVRAVGPVYEGEDARRWRIFASIFSRDYLLPYFKDRRSALLDLHAEINASRYSAFAEFVAWYYQSLVARVADTLMARGRIEAPETSFKYALRSGR